MIYEWDENKRLANIKKHGLDFKNVNFVFENTNAVTILDDRKDYGEKRYKTIGLYKDEIVVVVICTQRNNAIRIISVRKANKKERSIYYGNSQI